MALPMSQKFVTNFCRLISLQRNFYQKHHIKVVSNVQFHRSSFPEYGLVNHGMFQQVSTEICLQRAPSLVQTCHQRLGLPYSSSSHSAENMTQSEACDGEDDKLYKWIELKVKGHDDAVLESYAKFVDLAAKELNITVESILKPTRQIKKLTLLKSRHVYKKHRVQYELRTYYREIKLKHLTGSTASVFLEYIERNLPEGLAMRVKKCSLERLPEHLMSRPADIDDHAEDTSSASSSSSDSEDEGNMTRGS